MGVPVAKACSLLASLLPQAPKCFMNSMHHTPVVAAVDCTRYESGGASPEAPQAWSATMILMMLFFVLLGKLSRVGDEGGCGETGFLGHRSCWAGRVWGKCVDDARDQPRF